MDADVSSTSVSLISADGGFDAELSTKHRPVSMMASDSHLKEVPAARIQALVRRLAQQPDPVSRPTSISTSVTMAAPHTPLETSRDVPESPNEAPHVLPDPHASDADDESKRPKKTKRFFSKTEDNIIMEAVKLRGENGENWQRIADMLVDRTPAQIRSRFKRIRSNPKGAAAVTADVDDDGESELNTSTAMQVDTDPSPANQHWGDDEAVRLSPAGTPASSHQSSNKSTSGAQKLMSSWLGSPTARAKRTNSESADAPAAKRSKQREDGSPYATTSTTPMSQAHLTQTRLNFGHESSVFNSSRSNSPTHRSRQEQQHDSLASSSDQAIMRSTRTYSAGIATGSASQWGVKVVVSEEIQKQIDDAVAVALEEKLKMYAKREEDWMANTAQLKEKIESLSLELQMRDSTLVSKDNNHALLVDHVTSQLKTVLRESEVNARAAIREKLAQDSTRLGYSSFGRSGEEFREGIALKLLKEKEQQLEEQRAAYEVTKKRLAKRKSALTTSTALSSLTEQPLSPSSINGSAMDLSAPSNFTFGTPVVPMTPEKELEDIIMQEQLIKVKVAALKVDEQNLAQQREVLRVETGLHYKELRRFQEEEASKFNNFPILHDRYLMLQLLGRGGFSEVYRAYDLKCFRYVACKIHQLAPHWTVEKRHSYMRHAERECEIHKALIHPRIVALYEIFEIDDSTFCTVMEYCPGGDLDSHLKQNKALPEAEARVIIAQLFDGLKYLMTREKDKQKIIHYDLKPGNLLFDENGGIKIADFGLSKIMDGDNDSMELTSQGAGTYWYLPPECFDIDKPKITGKVDVWSAGVILYQMLFGTKPFGNNISQKHILERNLIHANLKVEFPPSKKISDEAKSFLARCLTANVAQRPDALELSSDPFINFLSTTLAKKTAPPSSGAGKMGPPLRVSSLGASGSTSIGGGTITVVRK